MFLFTLSSTGTSHLTVCSPLKTQRANELLFQEFYIPVLESSIGHNHHLNFRAHARQPLHVVTLVDAKILSLATRESSVSAARSAVEAGHGPRD